MDSNKILNLYVVATPIGNLKDISLRALEVLRKVDYILCEDTRRARKLKTHYSFPARLVSFHEHNEQSRTPRVLRLMQEGKSFALISDAGTPLISDPGTTLIQKVIEAGLPFTYLPGPNAVIAALVLSGLRAEPFSFHGFLPVKKEAREDFLRALASLLSQTMVLLESPERVFSLVREIGEFLGDRPVAICRELTKVHEEVLRGTVSQLLPQLADRELVGEFTIVIGPGQTEQAVLSDAAIMTRFEQLQKEGRSRKEALSKLARESGRSRNELYRLLFKKE